MNRAILSVCAWLTLIVVALLLMVDGLYVTLIGYLA